MPSTPEDKSRDPLLGRVIAGKFEVQALLGVGAMGKVYRAHHAALDKMVAVKVLNAPEAARDPTLAVRFKSEARAASRLDHPNSVQILDFGEDGEDKLLYIAMELLQGQNLGAVLKRVGRLSALRACNIMTQVLAALAAAHRANVVHRDLKPANIMLVKKRDDEGEVNDFVKVCDFGIAKVMDTGAPDDATAMTMTKQGAIFGTPAYMSPEQARGEKVDFRTDIYSCGVILYRMIAGKTPFQAETAMGLLTKLMTEEAAPLSQSVSTIDPRLEALVHRALAKDRTQRFPSVLEMRAAIKEVLSEDGQNLTAPPLRPSSPSGDVGHDTVLVPPRSTSDPHALSSRSVPPANATHHGPQGTHAAPFQTLTGSAWQRPGSGTWTGTGSMPPREEAPAFKLSSLKLPLIVLAIAAVLAVLGLFVHNRYDKHAAVARLAEQVGMGSFGVAENMYNERFDEFRMNPASLSFIPEVLRQRRAAEGYEERLGIAFDPGYTLQASSWIGTYTSHDLKRSQRFILVFESVDGPMFTGYLEWPDVGLRAAIHGIRDGNHLVFWDFALISGEGAAAKKYKLQEKKNVFVKGDRFEGLDGPYLAKIEGALQKPL